MNVSDFRKLYNSVFPILFRVALRIANSEEEAQDLCHESFMKLYEKDMSFPSLDEAKYWLIRVVKNAALNYAKRKTRQTRVYQKAFHQMRTESEDSTVEVLRKEQAAEITSALEQLPDSLRGPIILKEYGDLNYKEIGRILGISEGNVKVRIFRARERLTQILKGDEEK